jgi:hypothetical protein
LTRSNKLMLGIFVVIFLFSLGGALWYKYMYMPDKIENDPEHKLPAVKIILTNGCGFEGLAKEFSDFLADKNIDIVSMGNTLRPIYDKTIIVIRKGDDEDFKRLQRMTGIMRFTMAKNETALADFEIIIGKDYEQYTNK